MTETSVPADNTSARLRRRSQKKGVLLFVRDVLVIFLVALLVSFLIKTFLVRSFFIPSSSMEQTLQIDDRILVNELVPNLVDLERGDVVVFRDPGGWLPPTAEPTQPPLVAAVDWVLSAVGLSASDSDDHLIKRVIGLPGDHVVCCNTLGQMSVNDVPLNEPYITLPAGVTNVSKDAFDVTVPANSLWVMGDNRYNSKDSRYNRQQPGNGFVPVDNVVGRAFVISWPSAHWSWLDNHPAVFAGIRDADQQ
ncbi:signal peptidase I [Okibacterium sp. HSC-33S16]|uniref:signal peptidase I n=1 Tax=Okibacterium sp. HSC-33S16 TaxID=2910965 RepID=UPI00209F12BC|nr:signal peptidase I [Okibacterium sp. HSC-33S16]MCP2030562.1 signal peptidase I [Okibacterium sp. HSC-33S16]